LARASACHAEGRGFESHHPLGSTSHSAVPGFPTLLRAALFRGGRGVARPM